MHPTLRSSKELLLEPFDSCLAGDAVKVFRTNYQQFRLGRARGARGEPFRRALADPPIQKLPSIIFDVLQVHSPLPEETIDEVVYEENSWEDSGSANVHVMLRIISEFRMAYRQFRRGGWQLTNQCALSRHTAQMTIRHLDLLPVTQHAKLLKGLSLQQRSGSSVGTEEGGGTTGGGGAVAGDDGMHVHFGAGKLGLGLILPALVRSGRPFAVLDPPLAAWDPLLNSAAREVAVEVNGEPLTSLTVVRPAEQEKGGEPHNAAAGGGDLLSGSKNKMKKRLLVLCGDSRVEDEMVLRQLIDSATSFSTSVGPGMPGVRDMLLRYKVAAHTATLYGCENDHKAVLLPVISVGGFLCVLLC
eukprot:GHVS01007677.1.p1 GENE.GHVS01007677.1~~GHVS01007677.1.p1  ORF type:complete len:358 (-),score=73.37 GHVS01007677.1:1052-2125(-)